jgi:uncharacterized membrane protein
MLRTIAAGLVGLIIATLIAEVIIIGVSAIFWGFWEEVPDWYIVPSVIIGLIAGAAGTTGGMEWERERQWNQRMRKEYPTFYSEINR